MEVVSLLLYLTMTQEVEMGDYETTFKLFEVAGRYKHGEQCAEVLHVVCLLLPLQLFQYCL